jgi:NAD(P)-dependent dehydrogenase (short-subunit alcohol dehydrogenase family)
LISLSSSHIALLKDKVILVTGGGSGIGRAACLLAAREGATIALCDLTDAGGRETQRLVEAEGADCLFVRTDVSDSSQVQQFFDQCMQKFGRLDGAVNNAGIDPEFDGDGGWHLDNLDQLYSIALRGVFDCMQHEVRCMRNHRGAIVNIGSIVSFTGAPTRPAYVACKHAIIGLMRTAALQFAANGVRVNAVCPGGTWTPLFERDKDLATAVIAATPLGRIAEASEVAEAIVWLLSDRSSYVTGHALMVDGGMLAH